MRRARHTSLLLALALASSLAPACSIRHSSSGLPLPDVDGLIVGESRKADVLRELGAPDSVRRQHDGDLFLYRRTDSRSRLLRLIPYLVIYERGRAESRYDQIAVLFDREGVLLGLGVEHEIPED